MGVEMMAMRDDDFRDLRPITLSRQQKECVQFGMLGPLRVHGIPGSGKTTVILKRAEWLSHRYPGQRILVLSYNKALARYMKALAQKAEAGDIEVRHFHEWGVVILKEIGIPKLFWADAKEKRPELIRYALNTVRKQNPDLEFPKILRNDKFEKGRLARFLGDEIKWIKSQAIRTEREYLDAERIGRGSLPRLAPGHRAAIWAVAEMYGKLGLTKKYNCRDYDDVPLLLLDNLDRIPTDRRPDHILIDEGQDFTAAQYRVLTSLAPKTITIAADKGQKIYRQPFTWRQVGVDVRGGRTKGLTQAYRSTKQIIELAESLLRHDPDLQKDEEYLKAATPTSEGTMPELFHSPDRVEELDHVTTRIMRLRTSFAGHTIGVLAKDNDRLDEFAAALDEARVPWVMIKDDGADLLSPGVKLATYHSAKGLEFDHVICTGLQEGIMPYTHVNPGDDAADALNAERRALYVGMTRARLTLTLSAVAPESRFISQLDSTLYEDIR